MPLPVFAIDGAAFVDLNGFARLFSSIVLTEHEWDGNLDAFNDILRGGFGTPEGGFVLRLKNCSAARAALGFPETARWYEQHAITCHPSGKADMLARMVQARSGQGETLFDMVLEIIRTHGPGGRESEDNVLLELEDDDATFRVR